MCRAESPKPKNTRNFSRVFDESGYSEERAECAIGDIDDLRNLVRLRASPLPPRYWRFSFPAIGRDCRREGVQAE
jgi:hypothetical protein